MKSIFSPYGSEQKSGIGSSFLGVLILVGVSVLVFDAGNQVFAQVVIQQGGSSTRNQPLILPLNQQPAQGSNSRNAPVTQNGSTTQTKVTKSPQQWHAQLNDIEYNVTREKGTEPAYSGKYWDNKQQGVYTCKCCGQSLFDSKTKFKSGTGWPSYFQPIDPKAVQNIADYAGGMVRTEVTCSRCDSHLGHVFNDGPQPTGLRYCMNSVSLDFKTEAEVAAMQNRNRQQIANPVLNQSDAVLQTSNVDGGYASAQQLLEAVRVAVAENSQEKFFNCISWNLPKSTQDRLRRANQKVTSKPVRSMELTSTMPNPPQGYKFNINPSGGVLLNYEDGTQTIWAYGVFGGKYFIGIPVPAN